ncbi:hypothetical protein L1856_07870 [Streptomyces sp. Tue 6430]|nr:hypothetical protein [Streptomyces sp. Tue 6430]
MGKTRLGRATRKTTAGRRSAAPGGGHRPRGRANPAVSAAPDGGSPSVPRRAGAAGAEGVAA